MNLKTPLEDEYGLGSIGLEKERWVMERWDELKLLYKLEGKKWAVGEDEQCGWVGLMGLGMRFMGLLGFS